jgi:hypothetical protein
VDLECKASIPCADRNRNGNSVPIPDGDSTKPSSRMSARIVEGLDLQIIENASGRTCEGQSAEKRPRGPSKQKSTGSSSIVPLFQTR